MTTVNQMRAIHGDKVYKARPNWHAGLPLIPVFVFLALLFFFPVIQLLTLSVQTKGELSGVHYMRLFESDVYIRSLLITLKVSFYTTLICVIAAYPLAYMLATASGQTRNSLILWVLMPFWTSFLVRTFAWLVLLGRNGPINKWLQGLGLLENPLEFFNMVGTMIGMVHALMPLAVMTMLSVMETIDANLPKAAATLGARGGQAFWRIYFPLSLPGLAAGGLLVFITALGFFITPTILGGGRIMMIAQLIIEQVEQLLNWGFAGAIALLLLLTALVIFYLYDRLLGMSTLSGSGSADRSAAGGGGGMIGRGGAYVGGIFINVIGWICDRFGELVEVVRPIRPDRPRKTMSRTIMWITGITMLVFLSAPSFFVIPVSFTEGGFLEWPPEGFGTRWYDLVFDSPTWRAAGIRSFSVGVISALLAMAISVPAAFVLTRHKLKGRTIYMSLLLSPLIIPRILIAVALFYSYAYVDKFLRIGLIGSSLGLVLGHAMLAVPYVVVTVMAVLKNYDYRLDQAAWSLGANKARTLWHITFPLIRAGLLAAFLFAFVTSFDELTIALFVSGGLATTLPKQMWDDALLKVSPGLAAASTLILIFVTSMIFLAEFLRRKASKS